MSATMLRRKCCCGGGTCMAIYRVMADDTDPLNPVWTTPQFMRVVCINDDNRDSYPPEGTWELFPPDVGMDFQPCVALTLVPPDGGPSSCEGNDDCALLGEGDFTAPDPPPFDVPEDCTNYCDHYIALAMLYTDPPASFTVTITGLTVSACDGGFSPRLDLVSIPTITRTLTGFSSDAGFSWSQDVIVDTGIDVTPLGFDCVTPDGSAPIRLKFRLTLSILPVLVGDECVPEFTVELSVYPSPIGSWAYAFLTTGNGTPSGVTLSGYPDCYYEDGGIVYGNYTCGGTATVTRVA